MARNKIVMCIVFGLLVSGCASTPESRLSKYNPLRFVGAAIGCAPSARDLHASAAMLSDEELLVTCPVEAMSPCQPLEPINDGDDLRLRIILDSRAYYECSTKHSLLASCINEHNARRSEGRTKGSGK